MQTDEKAEVLGGPAVELAKSINTEFAVGQVVTVLSNGTPYQACFRGAEAKGPKDAEVVFWTSKQSIINGPVTFRTLTGPRHGGVAETELHTVTNNVLKVRCVKDAG